MNKELFQGKWHEYKGKVKEKWGKLTDNDLTQINGKREELIGKLESQYGYAKDRAEKEINEFEKTFASKGSSSSSFNPNPKSSSFNPDHPRKS